MSLFFDSAWFDARLKATGLSRADLAAAMGLTQQQIDEMWKDQRELKASDVRILAVLLGVPPSEVAERAGISTPIPKEMSPASADVIDRLERIEKILEEIRAEIRALKK